VVLFLRTRYDSCFVCGGSVVCYLISTPQCHVTEIDALDIGDRESSNTPQSDHCLACLWQISWMECTVQSRLETGDHWVLYATVDSGAVQVYLIFGHNLSFLKSDLLKFSESNNQALQSWRMLV
jgi:hypothetical protein